jgi:hypothetical protein
VVRGCSIAGKSAVWLGRFYDDYEKQRPGPIMQDFLRLAFGLLSRHCGRLRGLAFHTDRGAGGLHESVWQGNILLGSHTTHLVLEQL